MSISDDRVRKISAQQHILKKATVNETHGEVSIQYLIQ